MRVVFNFLFMLNQKHRRRNIKTYFYKNERTTATATATRPTAAATATTTTAATTETTTTATTRAATTTITTTNI